MLASIGEKRKEELHVIEVMIQIYCKKKHGHKEGLCKECMALWDYASMRMEQCPFMSEKTFCSNCRVHCYKSDMREKVKEVMRLSGPRMLLVRPDLVLLHACHSFIHKRKEKGRRE